MLSSMRKKVTEYQQQGYAWNTHFSKALFLLFLSAYAWLAFFLPASPSSLLQNLFENKDNKNLFQGGGVYFFSHL